VELRDRASLEVSLPRLPPVQLDGGHLAQIILNLLVNSAQAIPPGQRDANRVLLAARRDGDVVEVSVTDTGPGIPADVLPHVFEPFFTTKQVEQGQGLGLAISRELVRKAGGVIEAENVSPHGARFTVRLPIAAETASSARAATATPPRPEAPLTAPTPPRTPSPVAPRPTDDRVPGATRPRLLLVDDEEILLRSFSRLLARTYEVQTASSGHAAIERLARGEEYDAILCDLMMPKGSGSDVARWLARERPALCGRLILMTGGVPDQQQTHVEEGITFPLLAKPFSITDVDAAVRRLRPPG
jgi:CheY-like chemotaxis protein